METRKVVASVLVAGGLVASAYGGAAINSVVSNPEHSTDIKQLEVYTSPDGDRARCDTTRSLEFQEALHDATGGEMTDADAELFAATLGAKGVIIDDRPISPQDLKDLTSADLSQVPGFDCGEEEGASTFVVINTLKKKAPIVLGGLATTIAGSAYLLGYRSGRKKRT